MGTRGEEDKGKHIGKCTFRIDVYENGLEVHSDDDIDFDLRIEVAKAMRDIFFKKYGTTIAHRMLNKFSVSRVLIGDTTKIYALFYRGVLQKHFGFFVKKADATEVLRAYRKHLADIGEDYNQYDVRTGVVRFSYY